MDKFKEAEEHTKTSMLKWTADYLSASSLYDSAGMIFRGKGDTKMAIESFKRSAVCHDKVSGHHLNAGLQFEKAANVAKNAKLNDDACALFQEASKRFVGSGDVIKAASSLSQAAQLSQDNPDGLFMQSVEIVRGIDKGKAQSLDIIRPALNYMIRNGDFHKSLAISQLLMDTHTALDQQSSAHKVRVGIVIIHLSRGDLVAAKKAFAEHMNNDDYLTSQECAAAEELINAYEKMDAEQLEKAKNQSVLNYLEREFVILMRQLKVTGATFTAPPVAVPPSLGFVSHSGLSSSTASAPAKSQAAPAPSYSQASSRPAASTTSTAAKAADFDLDAYMPSIPSKSQAKAAKEEEDIDLR